MSRCLLISFVLAAAGSAAAQGPWMQAVGGTGYDRFRDVHTLGQQVFLVGTKDEQAGTSAGWLLAMNGSGAHVLDAAYVDPTGAAVDFTHLTSGGPPLLPVLFDRDGPITRVVRELHRLAEPRLFVGGVVGVINFDQDIVLLALEPNGVIAWQRRLVLEGDATLGDLLATSDGGLLVVGKRLAPAALRRDAWVMKLSARGELQWFREHRSNAHDALESAVELPGGGYLLAGQVGVGKSQDSYQGWVLAMGPGGEVMWQKGYNAGSSDSIHRLLPASDGFLGVGRMNEESFFLSDAWLMEVDAQGSVLRSKWMGNFDSLGSDEIVDVVATPSGGFVTIGSTDTITGPFEQMWAAGFDNESQLLWTRHYGGNKLDQASSIAPAPGGGYLLAGWTQHPATIFDGFVSRTDASGGGFSSCSRTGTLPGVLFDLPLTVSTPDATAHAMDVRLVRGDLRRRASPTNTAVLCSN